jgi:hypothetical protein
MTYIPPHLRSPEEKDKLLFGKTLGKFVSSGELPKERVKSTLTEAMVHAQVCKYLKAQYPNVMFISDFAAGMKMSIGMASRQNMLKSNHSFPDIHVLEPRNGKHGLFIEVKKDDSIFYKGTREIKPVQHVLEQFECMYQLNKKGYEADFGCGFDECKNIIDNYLR